MSERTEWQDGYMHGLLHAIRVIQALERLGTMKDVPMTFRSLNKILTNDFEKAAQKWAEQEKKER